jgi:[ribosomal protein S5]-alanine N-acetyltransferase
MPFRLESPRCNVRPWEEADRPTFTRMVRDPEMVRYLGSGEPWEEARIDAFMQRQQDTLAKHGCCLAAVVLRETDEVMGLAGIQPLGDTGVFEIGWWIWKEHWNRGYATEVARALVHYAFERMRLPRVAAIANVPNTASRRVMEKVGLRYVDTRNARELAPRYPDIKVVYYLLENPAISV